MIFGVDGFYCIVCFFDCFDMCLFVVEVEDGKVVCFDGDECNFYMCSFICFKVCKYDCYVYGDECLM